MSQANTDFFCSQLSLEANEQLFGTASKVDVWFLLEYVDTWAAKAFEASKLPQSVKDRLFSYLSSIPNSRIQLIKQSSRSTPPIAFYVVISSELDPVLYKFQFTRYEDLLTINIPKLLDHNSEYGNLASEEPLYLVCTNGNRDKCCAKFGLQVYREMSKYGEDAIWQCTHIGGHRFAANVLCFPHGICYGRVMDDEVSALMEEYRQERIYLQRYRGRSCYTPHVQAADYFLRAGTEIKDISGFRLLKVQDINQDGWIVRFSETNNGKIHSVHISLQKSAFKNYLSCRDADKSDVDQYYLVKHEVLEFNVY
jgi:hypothetical protein